MPSRISFIQFPSYLSPLGNLYIICPFFNLLDLAEFLLTEIAADGGKLGFVFILIFFYFFSMVDWLLDYYDKFYDLIFKSFYRLMYYCLLL